MVDEAIDHEGLRQRYRVERDKRIRPDGTAQYREPTGRFASVVEDHYTERVERSAIGTGARHGGTCSTVSRCP